MTELKAVLDALAYWKQHMADLLKYGMVAKEGVLYADAQNAVAFFEERARWLLDQRAEWSRIEAEQDAQAYEAERVNHDH